MDGCTYLRICVYIYARMYVCTCMNLFMICVCVCLSIYLYTYSKIVEFNKDGNGAGIFNGNLQGADIGKAYVHSQKRSSLGRIKFYIFM